MQCSKPTILITGSDGFVGKNLVIKLEETNNFNLIYFNRNDTEEDLINGIGSSNFIIHLAGENRPKKEEDFYITNSNLTKSICESAKTRKRKIPIKNYHKHSYYSECIQNHIPNFCNIPT